MEENTKKTNGLGGKLLAGVYTVVICAFLFNLFRLSILPGGYFAAIAAMIIIISAILIKGLVSNKNGLMKKVAVILAVLFMIIAAIGTWYITSALDFVKKVSNDTDKEVHTYYAVVREKSSFETLSDIKGEKVGVMSNQDDEQAKACEELLKAVDVSFKDMGDYQQIATALIEKDIDVIFISSAFYEIAIDEIDGFTEDTVRILETSEVDSEKKKSEKKKVNVTEDSFNVYISGIDTKGSIRTVSRSDVNMVMTVNPKTKQILLTSIPRDYHVQLAGKGAMDKLTHSGIYGINETVSTVENLLDTDINYYVKVNFTTVTKLVDALGGITVYSDYDFNAAGYHYNAGANYLDGAQALAFARERYSFSSGDNQRVRNQQAVLKGIINKATGSSAILLKYNELLNALADNMDTNFQLKEITSLVKMQLEDMSGWEISPCSLSGSGNMTSVYSMPSSTVYVMEPNWSSVDAAKGKISSLMNS